MVKQNLSGTAVFHKYSKSTSKYLHNSNTTQFKTLISFYAPRLLQREVHIAVDCYDTGWLADDWSRLWTVAKWCILQLQLLLNIVMYYYDFCLLSTVWPSGVVNRVRLSQITNTHRCSLFTAPKQGALCHITTSYNLLPRLKNYNYLYKYKYTE